MRQLKDINGRLRICTRCNSGDPAVFKKSGEWLCEKCLDRRKERQAATAALPKCHKCNAPAMHGEMYCNNHIPKVDPLYELECRVTTLEQQLATAHRQGWEQCQREAVEVAKQTDFPPSPKSYYTLGRVDAANAIAAMECKERTND